MSLRPADLIGALREPLLRLVTRPRGMSRSVNGMPVRVASPARAVFAGDYDRPVADYLRSRITPGSEVWNVGANIGVYALQLATWVARRVTWWHSNPTQRQLDSFVRTSD